MAFAHILSRLVTMQAFFLCQGFTWNRDREVRQKATITRAIAHRYFPSQTIHDVVACIQIHHSPAKQCTKTRMARSLGWCATGVCAQPFVSAIVSVCRPTHPTTTHHTPHKDAPRGRTVTTKPGRRTIRAIYTQSSAAGRCLCVCVDGVGDARVIDPNGSLFGGFLWGIGGCSTQSHSIAPTWHTCDTLNVKCWWTVSVVFFVSYRHKSAVQTSIKYE